MEKRLVTFLFVLFSQALFHGFPASVLSLQPPWYLGPAPDRASDYRLKLATSLSQGVGGTRRGRDVVGVDEADLQLRPQCTGVEARVLLKCWRPLSEDTEPGDPQG